MLNTIVLDGAGTEGRTSRVIDPVAEQLAAKLSCAVEWQNWAASVMGAGGSTPWPAASHNAVIRLAHRIRTAPPGHRFILLGFSAGCRPVREFLDSHPELHHRIAAVGLLADPWQPHDRQQHGVPNGAGWGVMGSLPTPLMDRTFWCGHPGDPICRAAWDSLLRYLTAAADAVPGGLIRTFLDKARRGRLQLIPFLGLPPHEWFAGLGGRIDRSIAEARSYLGDGHTAVYTREFVTIDPDTGREDRRSLAHRLADSIAWKITHPQST
ncbi:MULTISPECIES: hypothetical protein [unclassified Dietzia]|uniref:hypothetical protein n=1 Tax=unclassified Dietzia TaxID=2617939 RepID=UPI0015FD405B|nr:MULTISPECIES: hypothetical protein [unclassified Dietzia]MBB1023346.1 alpha/beta hydrolase [Dietzia sp. DQ12-76]MBB1027523.1 alpha/beta hydrolase [Dietzia sp. DQ11-38-2]